MGVGAGLYMYDVVVKSSRSYLISCVFLFTYDAFMAIVRYVFANFTLQKLWRTNKHMEN